MVCPSVQPCIVQNASNVGYLNSEGEFVAVAPTQGDRDAMYQQTEPYC